MKLTETIGFHTWFCIIFHADFSACIVFCLKNTKVLQIIVKICVESYKIPLGLRKHVQISSCWVLSGAKDADKYFTDELREENK